MDKKQYAWDARDYAKHSGAQFSWAKELIQKLNLTGSESVLDIGCGDGKVTAQIAENLPHGHVVGIDNCDQMIALAQKTFPPDKFSNLTFVHADAAAMRFEKTFDIVFSNAALHWIMDHRPVLKGIQQALSPCGRCLLQMGGKGNAADIIKVLDDMMAGKKWQSYFKDFSFSYGFHDIDTYTQWLADAGLVPLRVELIDKVMSYDSCQGIEGWVRTTWLPYTDRVQETRKNEFITELVSRYLDRYPRDSRGQIHVNMVRLEVEPCQP